MPQRGLAFGLLATASVMNASFALPRKWMKRWSWQTGWLLWSIFALILLPLFAVVLTVPHAMLLFQSVPQIVLVRITLFGVGWGVAQVLFGLAIETAGVAISFAIVLGLSACLGSLLPLLLSSQRTVTNLPALFGGVAIMLVGVAACAYAGRLREIEADSVDHKSLAAGAVEPPARRTRGILLAVLGGILASFMNLGLDAAGLLKQAAVAASVQPYFTNNLAWVPLLAGGAIPNILYCLYLRRRKHSEGEFTMHGTSPYYLLAFSMAALWFGSTLLYGIAAFMLGSGGIIQGWPVFMSLIVIAAGTLGFLLGEWRDTRRAVTAWQVFGMTVLVAGVFVLSETQV